MTLLRISWWQKRNEKLAGPRGLIIDDARERIGEWESSFINFTRMSGYCFPPRFFWSSFLFLDT